MEINDLKRQHDIQVNARYTRGKFLQLLSYCVEGYPNYTLAEHLITLLRKGEKEHQQPYFWDDSKMLKKIELYYKNLQKEFPNENEEDEDFN